MTINLSDQLNRLNVKEFNLNVNGKKVKNSYIATVVVLF